MRLLHAYLWLIMLVLLVQGLGCLLIPRIVPALDANALVAAIFSSNPPHASVHVVWGAAGLVVLATQRKPAARWWFGLVFGIFYTLLGVLGLALHNPFGLMLGVVENTFHLTAGPLMLVLVAVSTSGLRQPALSRP